MSLANHSTKIAQTLYQKGALNKNRLDEMVATQELSEASYLQIIGTK